MSYLTEMFAVLTRDRNLDWIEMFSVISVDMKHAQKSKRSKNSPPPQTTFLLSKKATQRAFRFNHLTLVVCHELKQFFDIFIRYKDMRVFLFSVFLQ